MEKIVLPNINEELAEIIGAVIGDGTIPNSKNYNYALSIYGNANKDVEYINYLKNQFKKLFCIDMKISYAPNNSLYIRKGSKQLCEFFVNNLGFNYGPKTNIDIPNFIKTDETFSKMCIRGIFDTDGCMTVQKFSKYKYPLIKLTTKSHALACSLKDLLRTLTFNAFISIKKRKPNIIYDVVIKGFYQVEKFYSIIGSSNARNITVFTKYKKDIKLQEHYAFQNINKNQRGKKE
jgi:DNA-binding transcriptional regulator WhiA